MTVSQATVNNYLKQYGYAQPTMTSPVQPTEDVSQALVSQSGQQQVAAPSGDGSDDGKISFGKKLKNFGKGCLKFITGMFTGKDGKFSWKQTLKSVGIMAAGIALSWCTGGSSLALAAVAVGAVAGGVKVVKGAVKASKAQTDSEAESAWQDIGLGATTLGVSVLGAKGAMAKASGGTFKGNALQATKQCFVQTGKNALSAGKSIRGSFQAGTLKADFASLASQGKTNFTANLNSTFGSGKAFSNFQNKEIAKIDKQIAKLDVNKDADLISQLTARKQTLNSEFGHIQNATSTDDITNIIKTSEDKLQALKTAGASKEEIAAMQQQVKTLQAAGQIQTGQIKNLVAQTEIKANKIAKLTEQIDKLDKAKDTEKIAELTTQRNGLINEFNINKKVLSSFDVTKLDKITAQEAKAVISSQYVTPLKQPVINQVKNNPFISRNVEEALVAQGLTEEQIAQIQAQQMQQPQNQQQNAYMPQYTPVDYTSQYFDQYRFNNPFQA